MAEATLTTKRCPKCSRDLPREAFAKDKRRPDGLKCWCKACHNAAGRARWAGADKASKDGHAARNREWREANRDAARRHVRDWQKRNPEATRDAFVQWRAEHPAHVKAYSANERGLPDKLRGKEVEAIYAAQGGRCAYCKTDLSDGYHLDHITPIFRGGRNIARNVQLTCDPCNRRKWAKDPVQFAQEIGLLI